MVNGLLRSAMVNRLQQKTRLGNLCLCAASPIGKETAIWPRDRPYARLRGMCVECRSRSRERFPCWMSCSLGGASMRVRSPSARFGSWEHVQTGLRLPVEIWGLSLAYHEGLFAT